MDVESRHNWNALKISISMQICSFCENLQNTLIQENFRLLSNKNQLPTKLQKVWKFSNYKREQSFKKLENLKFQS